MRLIVRNNPVDHGPERDVRSGPWSTGLLRTMSRIAYVNGSYVPQREAAVSIEDRGYQFADGVYEVVHLHGGRFIDEDRHLDRLDRSLREIRIAAPMGRAALRCVLREVVHRNRIAEG